MDSSVLRKYLGLWDVFVSKRKRISKIDKWIKQGRGSGIGAGYKLWLKIRNVSSL